MIKKILFWIVLINLFGLQTIAQSDIIPLKKPIQSDELTKKTTEIKISKYYRKKDFALAKKAISEMKKASWTAAIKTAKRAKDKSIYDFIQWRHLLTCLLYTSPSPRDH